MAHNADQIAADAKRLADHHCPECNADFRPMKRADVSAHIDHEFLHGEERVHDRTDYGRRYRALRAYVAERFHEVN